MVQDNVVQTIYAAIRRINELRRPEGQLPCREETVLYGSNGSLNSLDLVSLILDVEEAINAQAGTQVVLADAHAMSQKRNPFRDVQSLADYVMTRLEESSPCPTER
jgi:acyl carrier protein